MKTITGGALQAWKRVRDLNLRIRSDALTPEERALLHAELGRAVARFRSAYAEERMRLEASRGASSQSAAGPPRGQLGVGSYPIARPDSVA